MPTLRGLITSGCLGPRTPGHPETVRRPASFVGADQARSAGGATSRAGTMNLVSFALRRPISLLIMVVAVALVGFLGARSYVATHLPGSGRPSAVCRAALRRYGSGADGRLHCQLLRVPLPLHHRHRACR